MKRSAVKVNPSLSIYHRIRQILDSARANAACGESEATAQDGNTALIPHAVRMESWTPGQLLKTYTYRGTSSAER